MRLWLAPLLCSHAAVHHVGWKCLFVFALFKQEAASWATPDGEHIYRAAHPSPHTFFCTSHTSPHTASSTLLDSPSTRAVPSSTFTSSWP
jgi:hypothetical protein